MELYIGADRNQAFILICVTKSCNHTFTFVIECCQQELSYLCHELDFTQQTCEGVSIPEWRLPIKVASTALDIRMKPWQQYFLRLYIVQNGVTVQATTRLYILPPPIILDNIYSECVFYHMRTLNTDIFSESSERAFLIRTHSNYCLLHFIKPTSNTHYTPYLFSLS